MFEAVARCLFQHSDAIQRDIALLSDPASCEPVPVPALLLAQPMQDTSSPTYPHPFGPHRTDLPSPQLQKSSVGKFDTFVYPCGNIIDFHKGLATRIGFPHLQFKVAMRQEHCVLAGFCMDFTSRNYGITTSPEAEWEAVVDGKQPPKENMCHGRTIPSVAEKLGCELAKKAKLREEEVIALILYTGPMYVIYNCILAQKSQPSYIWDTLRCGNNLYATTLGVLVSAVQKLSAVTVIPDGLLLYRGTGGLAYLPDYFYEPDECNCRGITDYGFLSSSVHKHVALMYSGLQEGRPHAMVLEIEPSAVDRGASVREFSQFKDEDEYVFLPCSFVQPSGKYRTEKYELGSLLVVPVRLNVNLKAEKLEQLEEKQKDIHVTGFRYRIAELRQMLTRTATVENAESRLKSDRFEHKRRKLHTVSGLIDALVSKVEAVFERHKRCDAAVYASEVTFRRLVVESLEAVRMAGSHLTLWLKNETITVMEAEEYDLVDGHRLLQSYLKHQLSNASPADRQCAAQQLCKARGLIRSDPNEEDENGESRLLSAAAEGVSADDLCILVAAGANFRADEERGRPAIYKAARQGHVLCIKALVKLGENVDSTKSNGATPLYVAAVQGHVYCIQTLAKLGADINRPKTKGNVTPLHAAAQNGRLDCIHALLQLRANIDCVKHNGVSSVFLAASHGRTAVVKALAQQKANLNLMKHDGTSPVFIAAQNGHASCVEILVSFGADAQSPRNDGVTPTQIARKHQHSDCVEMLEEISKA